MATPVKFTHCLVQLERVCYKQANFSLSEVVMSSYSKFFILGFRKMIPITTGVIPFGAVMGTVFYNAQLGFFQSMAMNIFMYSGSAQLAVIDLMTKHAASVVVIVTGLVINLRFLLYSAGLSPYLQQSSFWTKLICAHTLTDQSYAVMTANTSLHRTKSDTIAFYLGTAACMWLVWQISVVSGYIFGNFAPTSWSLDFAVPLSFVALVIPTLKNNKYVMVAIFSSLLSLLFHGLPYKLGLIATATCAIALAAVLTRKGPRA
jgi:predicted branched-subunit amino acid permease